MYCAREAVQKNIITMDEYKRVAVLDTITYLKEHKEYEFVKNVGHGTYGAVIELQCPDKTYNVAAKIMLQELVSKSEIDTWPQLAHENVLPLISMEHITPTYCYVFITPLHPTSLNSMVEGYDLGKDKKGFEKAIAWLYGVCRGVQYLHKEKLCHLDIKLSNVLISDEGTAVLCDFGSLTRTEGPADRLEILLYAIISNNFYIIIKQM